MFGKLVWPWLGTLGKGGIGGASCDRALGAVHVCSFKSSTS